MNSMPLAIGDSAKLLRNPPDCATLTITLDTIIMVQDRCRTNRISRLVTTLTAMREVHYP